MATLTRVLAALALSLAAWPAHAQMTTGSVIGRITDAQGAAIPGVAVQARNTDTGFTRADTTDQTGSYRLSALPVGSYTISAELAGFRRYEAANVAVNIGREIALDATLQVGLAQAITVTATPDLIATRSSSVGEVVDLARIEGLPLNGRQFANLAATVPGVGLGFHSDSTKSAQYTPQISGGNGRNVNYIVDGGDNNDDTVGGLLQLFPLEAIQEFDVITQRFDAEYGRSNGAVLNVVTKSGTNQVRGSWFTLVRDDALNARTFTEQLQNVPKQAYHRYQFGGSLGGPLQRDRIHYFAAYERTQQDTRQAVTTFGIFPAEEGVFDVPFRQNLFTAKVTATPAPAHYVAVRYGSDRNSQPSGATPNATHSSWTTSTNHFNSVNVNHNWVVGQSMLNELVVQYADFLNDVPANGSGPAFRFNFLVTAGTNIGAPQRTEQKKFQLRNDFSRETTGLGGLSHSLKAGVNWIHEPRLRAFAGQGTSGIYEVSALALNGPVTNVIVIGGNTTSDIPVDLFGIYAQDTWRLTDRITLNLGARWDVVDGMPIDQSTSANFLAMQTAARAGRFDGTILEEFKHAPRHDLDNIQPRLGAVIDLRGDGRDVVRGGWGIYTDFSYTNSNALVAAIDAARGGIVFTAADPAGLRKLDGTLFTINDPIAAIAHLNAIPAGAIPAGEVVSPVLEEPYTRQANLGWAHQIGAATVISADYVRVDGRDLNMRLRPNVVVNAPARFLSGVGVIPNNINFRTALSRGSSRYDALITAWRRRMSDGLDITASYTLAKATSDVGTAYDELAQNLVQDIRDPFAAVQQGPSARTDSRHQVSISAIVRAPFDINVAPIFFYRSPLPMHTIEGIDRNADGVVNEPTPVTYRYTGLTDAGVATFDTGGACATVNCSRRAPFSQLNLRVSRGFRIAGAARVEAIAEVFNLFNAKNPALPFSQRRIQANGIVTPLFMQPSGYAGDVGQPEQRVGQIGFRITF